MEDFINLRAEVDSLKASVQNILANQNIVIQKTSQLLNDGEDGLDPFATESQLPSYTLVPHGVTPHLYLFKLGNTVLTSLNLSQYVDGASAILSGSIDSNGLATFTRADNSTFTIDFASFLGDTVSKNQLEVVYYVAGGDILFPGNNTTAEPNDITKPYADIDTVLNLYPNNVYSDKTVKIRLVGNGLFPINGQIPFFGSLTIESEFSASIDLVNNNNTNLFKTLAVSGSRPCQTYINLPLGGIFCDRTGYSCPTITGTDLHSVVLKINTLFWKGNSSVFNCKNVRVTGRIMEVYLSNTMFSNNTVLVNKVLEIDTLFCYTASNIRLFNTKGKTIEIGKIDMKNGNFPTNGFYEESVKIGNIEGDSSLNQFYLTAPGTFLNIEFRDTVTVNPIQLSFGGTITGKISQCTSFTTAANSVDLTVENFFVKTTSINLHNTFLFMGSANATLKNVFVDTFQNNLITTNGSAVIVTIDNLDVNHNSNTTDETYLIAGGMPSITPTINLGRVSHNYTSLTNWSLSGKTYIVNRKVQGRSTVVNSGEFYENAPRSGNFIFGSATGIDASGSVGTVVKKGDIAHVSRSTEAELNAAGLVSNGHTHWYTVHLKNYHTENRFPVRVDIVGRSSSINTYFWYTPYDYNKIIVCVSELVNQTQAFSIQIETYLTL